MSANQEINLAPNHKMGLPLPNPVMLAAGVLGYGELTLRGLDPTILGGVVVGPVTRHSSAGQEGVRMAEGLGGTVLNSGGQNRGVSAVVRKLTHHWPRLGCPVILHIGDTRPGAAAATAQKLAGVDGLMGLEVGIPHGTYDEEAWELVQAVVRRTDLPVLARLPLNRATDLASAVVEAGACALVMGQPPRGQLPGPDQHSSVVGALYGPLIFPIMLAALGEVMRLNLGVPLVACGGIHTPAQARHALTAGAIALQIDSAAWIEPGLPGRIVEQFEIERG
jgi:dihydroorotate dehydrogenase (NAD+) catalytic subunit